MGYKTSTIDRLVRGDGSIDSAFHAQRVLKSWSLDISQLPALPYAGPAEGETLEPWEQEGLGLLRELRANASQAKWDYEMDRLRDLNDAFRKVAEGTVEPRPVATSTRRS